VGLEFVSQSFTCRVAFSGWAAIPVWVEANAWFHFCNYRSAFAADPSIRNDSVQSLLSRLHNSVSASFDPITKSRWLSLKKNGVLVSFQPSISRTFFVRKFVQSQTLSREKTFVRKMQAKNVDEIDARCLFHQYFLSSFFMQKCLCSFFLVTAWLYIFLSKKY